jgi:hypothetical protein
MLLTPFLVICSYLLSCVGDYAYIRDTLSGTTKPNRISWAMWALAPLIATYISFSEGVDIWSIARTFSAGFFPLIVLLATSFNTKSYWKLNTFDYMCGFLSITALIVWVYAHTANTAILLLVIADAFAGLPVLIKMWRSPETETKLTYILAFISVVITIPAVSHWDITHAAFQIYLGTITTLFLLVLYRKNIVAVLRQSRKK